MKIVFNFISGAVSYFEFKANLLKNDDIFNWLQSLLNDNMLNDVDFYCYRALRRYKHSLKECIMMDLSDRIGNMLNTYSFIYEYLHYAFPDKEIITTNYYDKLDNIYIKSVPDCYGGPEVDEMLSKIVMEAPEDLSTTKKVALIKSRIKELFPGKRPYWIQSAEWPVYNGKPMLYIERKHDGDLYQYIFEDFETGQRRVVEQFA